ncbi:MULTISPECIES: hypothetical protein [unclassified Sphingomonas]|uniref:hypothetical protein n=1 Tax=unclassified Sphingomonas TaxID=196159 RepID=UPI00226ABAC1|nr:MULTISPECIES: hypothetical protein [unclassified Sphingomonas]
MFTLITGLSAAALVPAAATSSAVCDVGRVALRDLPKSDRNPDYDIYYAGAGRPREDLLATCPQLQSELPAGYPLADDDARKRASVGAPIPGHFTRPAFIYSIRIAVLSVDRKTATVFFDRSCTGLCGGRSEAHYVRTSKGWKRQGVIRTLYVS